MGQDQVAHVELTREVARRFNQFYKLNGQEVLPEPQALLTPSPKLPGTDGRKMSKSYGNTILLSDPEPVVRQKLKTMVTDPARIRRSDPGDPDKCPVGDLHKLFSRAETLEKVYEGCRSAGIGCIECKSWLADAVVDELAPIQERRRKFEAKPDQVWDILRDGSARARSRADQTMRRCATRCICHRAKPYPQAQHDDGLLSIPGRRGTHECGGRRSRDRGEKPRGFCNGC